MQKIRIDFDNPGLPQHISAVENDSQSRFFQATLYENGKAYTAPEGAAYSIMYRGFGPQNQGWYDTINDGAGKRAACTVSGNVVTCEIARQALQVPGHVSIVLCVTTGKGYMLKSWPIECDCKNDRYDSTVEIQSFFYVTQISNESWTQAIQAVEDLKNTIDPTLSLSGKAAEAKAAGDALKEEAERAKGVESGLKEDLGNIQIDKLPIYTSSVVNANKDIFDGSVTNITDGPNVIGGDFIGKITGEIVHWFSCRMTIANTGFQDFRKKHPKIKLALNCSAQTNLIVCTTPNTSTFYDGGLWNSYINFNDKSARIIPIDLSGDEYNDIDRLCIHLILSCHNSVLYVTNAIGEYKISYFLFDEDINFLSPKSSKCVESEYAGYSREAKHSEDSTRFAGHTENEFEKYKNFIVYYGDSLTMYGGWTQIIEQKSGMTGYNFGIGGEKVPTIACRAGGDSMIVPAGVTIGRTASIVRIADKNGINTLLGYKAFPNRNGSTNDLGKLVNPIHIGESKQLFLLYRSGSDDTEEWGIAACDESLNIVSLSSPFVVNSPMLIRCSKNTKEYQSPKVLFVFIGTNHGDFKTLDEYVMFNKLIRNHIGAKHTIFLGLTIGSPSSYFPSGQTITTYSDYYQRMKTEFGTYFINLHDYLLNYGLADAGIEPTISDNENISAGKIPTSLTTDGVHYTDTAKKIIGNYIYRRCCEINVF